MNIKEIEERSGLTRANIRYYERVRPLRSSISLMFIGSPSALCADPSQCYDTAL